MMTYEEVKEELIKRGFPKSSVEAKYIPHVLDIALGTDCFVKLSKIEEELERQERRVTEARYNALCRVQHAEDEANATVAQMNRDKEYIANFYKALFDCDTDEGKDIMRTAQVFINSVNVNTKYDNTAFIVGLAAILSGGKVGAIEELHKLNTKIPSANEALAVTI